MLQLVQENGGGLLLAAMDDFEIIAHHHTGNHSNGHDFSDGNIGRENAAPESNYCDVAKANGAACHKSVPDAFAVCVNIRLNKRNEKCYNKEINDEGVKYFVGCASFNNSPQQSPVFHSASFPAKK